MFSLWPVDLDEGPVWTYGPHRVDGLTAAQWKRRYEGMVKERDDQIRRKREARRILQARIDALSE